MPGKGVFISFEGPEGSGKSTQAALLAAFLREQGLSVLETREPGGTPTGEEIRRILQHDSTDEAISDQAEVLLFAASRAQHVQHVIQPALAAGTWVLCDRYMDSSVVYQGFGRSQPVEEVLQINYYAVAGVMPDLTLLLDVDVDTSLARMHARTDETGVQLDRIEQEKRSFHERVRQGYLQLATENADRFIKVDGAASVEDIFSWIQSMVKERFRDRL